MLFEQDHFLKGINMQVDNKAFSNSAEEARSLEKMSALEAAIYLPSHYIQMLAGEKDSAVSKEELGFIIRRSDIHSVRAYVSESRKLPVDYNKIVAWFGLDTTSVPGLEPASIQSFHQRVVQHAGSWSALERETKELARQLNRFSDSFITHANGIIELINRLDSDRLFSGGLDDLTTAETAQLADGLSSTELKAVTIMREHVKSIKSSAESYIKRAYEVGALAAEFERVLSDELTHEVNAKLDAYAKAGLSRDRETLTARIKELDSEIERLIRDYRSQVLYGHSGIFLGPIGLAVTGGIFGVKAEAIRTRKNKLIAERDIARQGSQEQEQLAMVLDATQQRFTDLRSRMLGAEEGAKRLAQVWSYISNYLDEVDHELGYVDSFGRLYKLKVDFAQLLNPWKRVKDYSVQISNAFNEIIEKRI
ncbi:alpha-xenorhabdolysin family binary toxin subunit A [Pseudomonas sp. CCC4.1]|uniref:alpha-xenorhabdolysin family binary toxin subunit A n=1 Tax=Pseudomonas TaxID=286 RepID=UPI0020CC904C|nr:MULTISPECIES: alpha-xenorhabdolysin family binary toxin subunit A [Pseudomonas]MDY7571232.1 alpha-xenorhabdolysin family binary toxin subunit A [Pseudomonas sp. CCC4.1]MEB0144454.1 alpha-xenorhabdolysin family binary toxin subunit A [Pseudomonas sp. CCC4.1]